ncbi:MAG: flagellar hook-basal body complex protein FliE, partial [Pseudolabrys sp.]|nr:flagellar hook-basal body complex protein FliE [Pseudolabrys sp.]
KSDIQSQALVNGKSNMVDVVTAVAETEVAIDAVVAVRDKVIAAYEEIMRMPI